MSLIRFKNIFLQLGHQLLFDDVSFAIEHKAKIAILGRNGMGKSTLMKMIQGEIEPDNGQIEIKPGTRIATMPQNIPDNISGRLFDFVKKSFIHEHEWSSTHQIEKALASVQLGPKREMISLSGGELRRALLAQAIVNDPDVLLLDEPTNHLDVTAIENLENFLKNFHKTIILITHDRTFLQNLVSHILEIDLAKVTCFTGTYQEYLQFKETQLTTQSNLDEKFNKKLAQEEAWIRQGIKARRTRNEGRVRALKRMRQEHANRLQNLGTANIQQNAVDHSGKLVFAIDKINYAFQDKMIVRDFSSSILRGDKIGIIGPNGCGKSTFLKLLLQEVAASSGTVKIGTKLNIAYFDQHRQQLDLSKSAIDNISEGREFITINNQEKHVIGYLQDFLFTPKKAMSPVRSFSGGERNRLLLAKILSKPANLLILDEPTNDLDIETLELLEEFLLNYTGTLLMVSHDRTLLNNVITSTLVFIGNGKIIESVGGYDDWLRHQKTLDLAPISNASATATKAAAKTSSQAAKKTAQNLSRDERQELRRLPGIIEKLEEKIQKIHQLMTAPDFYEQNTKPINQAQQELAALNQELEKAYQRWEELE